MCGSTLSPTRSLQNKKLVQLCVLSKVFFSPSKHMHCNDKIASGHESTSKKDFPSSGKIVP